MRAKAKLKIKARPSYDNRFEDACLSFAVVTVVYTMVLCLLPLVQ